MLVSFEPLVGRFVRPLVVALYYVNYHVFGLTPWPYHLTLVLVHSTTAWLVFLTARRLAGGETVWAFLAGLLFLVFAGHSEAVAWTAGAADTLMTPCLLAAIYCYLRALDPAASRAWIAGCFAAAIAASLAKESWVILPAVLLAHAIAVGVGCAPARRRAALLVGGSIALVAAYLAVRHYLFGSAAAAAYADLGASLGERFVPQLRAFLLRAVLPPGRFAAEVWLTGRDLWIWPSAAVLVAVVARGRALRLLVFAVLAMALALAPALPLTIAIGATESERFVYLATAFSSMLVVWTIRSVVEARRRGSASAIGVAVCLVLAAAHAVVLVRMTGRWRDAGTMARTAVDTFAGQVMRYDPGNLSDLYLLNAPDNMHGTYVFRVGFNDAVRLTHPEAAPHLASMVGVATQSVGFDDPVVVRRRGARGFDIAFGSNDIIQPEIPSSFVFKVSNQTAHSYSIDFTEHLGRAVVLYLSRGRYEAAGEVEGLGAPFGAIASPENEARCDGREMPVSGWALDRRGTRRVWIQARAADPGTTAQIGDVRPGGGMPADIAPWYRAFPGTDRAGWMADVPCAIVRGAPGGRLEIQVVAETSDRIRRVIGTRTLLAGDAAARMQ